MTVPFYNFHDLHDEELRNQVKEMIGEIIDNNAFVEGKYNAEFEEKFAKMQGAKHCLLLANGTDALEISLLAYGIKPGDKVGVPGITFHASAEAVLNVNAEVVHIDVDPKTGLICPESTERMIKEHDLKAIIPVHIYGLNAPIAELEEVCAKYDVKIIEDSAQAQGTFYKNGKPVGSSNNLVTFSFYPTKNLGAFGDAGAILTNDDELAKRIVVIRNHGRGDDNAYGRNSRCDHMQAAVLVAKLPKIENYNLQRKEVAKKYHEALKDLSVQLLPEEYIQSSSWHLYPLQLESVALREKVQAHFKEVGIGCTPFYESALVDQKPIDKCPGEYEVARSFAGKTICLPMHPFITDEDVNFIKEEFKKVLG